MVSREPGPGGLSRDRRPAVFTCSLTVLSTDYRTSARLRLRESTLFTCTIPSPLHSGQIGRETERAVPTVPVPSQTPQLGQSSCRRNASFSIACFFGSATICDTPPLLLAYVVVSIGRYRRPCPDQIGVIPVILVFPIAWAAVVAANPPSRADPGHRRVGRGPGARPRSAPRRCGRARVGIGKLVVILGRAQEPLSARAGQRTGTYPASFAHRKPM